MRKVWLSFVTIAALMVVVALPAVAATPDCNKSLNWSSLGGPAITQPTVPSIPGNCAPIAPTTGSIGVNDQCSKLNISDILKQVQSQFGDCFKGLTGAANYPTPVSNCNQ